MMRDHHGADMTDARTPIDIVELDPLTFPLCGSRLIEASAGTGKTFTIALLYVRAILGHGDIAATGKLLTPRDLLVVTFTEAATKELRDRIRKRLAEAAEVFRGEPDSLQASDQQDDPLLQLRASYPDPAEWPAKARLLQLAAESMDEAAVHTIHGWCNRMLKEHAFDSGGLFNQNLETDQSELFAQVVRDYWRTFVSPLDADAADLWLGCFSAPDLLQDRVGSLLAYLDTLPEDGGSPAVQLGDLVALRRRVFDELRPGMAGWVEDFRSVVAEARSRKAFNGSKLRDNHLAGWLEKLLEWAAGDDLAAPGLTEPAWNRLSPEGIADAWKDAGPEEHPLVVGVGRLRDICGRQVSPESLLFHACRWISRRLEREKQRRAEMGFDDLLTRLDTALHGPGGERLAATIRQQFPLAMIDEFQDTDPVQYRIFDAVYRVAENNRNTGFFMIGDPKQAIYAFRGADIFTYLKARQATEGRHVTLPKNFRSALAMVEAANQVFAYGEQKARHGAFLFRDHGGAGANPVPFLSVRAQGRKEWLEVDGQQPPAMSFWTDTNTDNKPVVQDRTAEACASEIVRLLNLGVQGRAGFRRPDDELVPLRSSDIAILVNNGTEAGRVREALSRRGVKSVYLSDRASVLQTPEARDVLAWLKACAEPERDQLVRAALATATLGLEWSTLDHLRRSELAWEEEIEAFRSFHTAWRRQGVLAMIRQLLARFDAPARLLAGEGGERSLTDVLHLAELLQRESQRVDGEQALIRAYGDMLADGGKGSEVLQVRLESDADLVQVVTVHKSKGLEYPLVFLPYATSCRPVNKKDTPLSWHDGDGRLALVFSADEDALARADRERLAEDIRKLYVALTRARHATWVGAPDIKGEEQRCALGYLAGHDGSQSLQGCLEQMTATCATMAVSPLPPASDDLYTPEQPHSLVDARVPARQAKENWWIASYSAIRYQAADSPSQPVRPGGEAETPEAERQREESVPLGQVLPPPTRHPHPDTRRIHGFYRGAGPGTFLHGILEWCAREGFAAVAGDPAGLRELIQRACQSRGWTPWAGPLLNWAGDLLEAPLPLPSQPDGPAMPVALGSLSRVLPEMEFWFASHQVDTTALDALVRQHTLTGHDDPAIRNRPQARSATLNGMLKGFIDLVFEHDGRYYVADYKSNYLGPDDPSYTPHAMALAVAGHRYDLQYAIYLLALHRLLSARLPDYDYDRHIGGAVYLFLRGNGGEQGGVHLDRPDRRLIEAMDRLFQARTEPRADGVMEQEALL